jgi:hypothetical protein
MVRDIRIDCSLPAWPVGGGWGWRWAFDDAEIIVEFRGRDQCAITAKIGDQEETTSVKLSASQLHSGAAIVASFVVRDGQAAVLLDETLITALSFLPEELVKQPPASGIRRC